MIRCRVLNVLLAVIPINGIKDRLIQRHINKCPGCRESLASREEIQRVLIREADIGSLDGFWPGIRKKLEKPGLTLKGSGRGHRLNLGFSAAGALVGFLAVAFSLNTFLTRFSPSNTLGGAFEIHHIRVDNQPARTFIVQPRETDMILVWAEKSPKEETGYGM